MIIEIPNDNSIVKWKNDNKDKWKVAEISDLIKAYERPQGEWISNGSKGFFNPGRKCSICGKPTEFSENFCPNCGADMRGNING